MKNRVWLAALAAVALVRPGHADEAVPSPITGQYVVVVGVGEFADPAIEARPTAEADARAFYDLFADPAFGPGRDRTILLTATPDEKRNSRKATRANVVAALHEAAEKTGKDDTIIVALFGRGASSGDETCLFTAETVFKERAKTGLLGADLEMELKPARDRKVALLLDVSFKGFDAGKETLAEPSLRDVFAAVFGGEDKGGEQPPPQNKVVMLASVPANPPVADGDNGVFAKTALAALRGDADTFGYGPDGLIVVDELVKYLETNVPTRTRELGKSPQEKEAVPFIVGEDTAHFPITKNPKLTATVAKRQAAIMALEQAKTLSKDVAAETINLIGRMPKLNALQELRKNAEKLSDGAISPAEFTKARDSIKTGMVLSDDEADTYARTVLKAIDAVRSDYVKPIEAGEWVAYAVKGLYRRLEEPLPDDIEAQIQEPKGLARSALAELLKSARTKLGKREDLEGTKDIDTTVLMMFAELRDPYTTYYDEALIAKMDAPLRGEFRGVGIQIRRDLVRDGLLVVSPIKDSPAYKAGIRAGDLITAIKRKVDKNGLPLGPDDPAEISTKGMKTEKALELILGTVGVPVTLVVERDGQSQEFTIKRGLVAVETVLGAKRDESDDWTYFLDDDSKIGYVCLTQFAPTTARDLKEAVRKMRRAGMKGLVLDLRFNPGGLLTQAVAVCDLFLEGGLIVSVKYRNRESERWFDRGFGSETGFPIAVLVNGQSASASEIVSACLQDYGRAIVVGERTYGKGSVQSIKDFPPTKAQIKLTTARYFPPLDRNIDKLSTKGSPEDEWGVQPDKGYEVKLTREEIQDLAEYFREREVIKPPEKKEGKVVKDRQLEKAIEYLKRQTNAAAAGQPNTDG